MHAVNRAVRSIASDVEHPHTRRMDFLYSTHSYPNEMLANIARNQSLCEAEIGQPLAHIDVKVLGAMRKAHLTLHPLKFCSNRLPKEAPRMLARSLKKDVFLKLEFHVMPIDMHTVLSDLNRNRTALNNAVKCILYDTVDVASIRALRLLSASDSLLDALVSASGKTCIACKC